MIRQRLFTGLLIVTGLLLWISVTPERKSADNKLRLIESVTQPDFSVENPAKAGASRILDRNLPDKPNQELTLIERKSLDEMLNAIQTSFFDYEKSVRKIVYEKSRDDCDLVVVHIPAPGSNELGKASEIISKALSKPTISIALKKKLREQGETEITKYAAYPKPEKVIHILTPSNPKAPIEFSEYYVDTLKEGLPNEEGVFVVPIAGMKSDFRFGSDTSWAAKRYAHLISSEK